MVGRRWVVALAAAIALSAAACDRYSTVEPGRVEIGGDYTVAPDIRWSKRDRGNLEAWTVHGTLLHQLFFTKGLEVGEYLFQVTGRNRKRREKRRPKYRGDMTPIEIAEFFEASVVQSGVATIRTERLRPARFGKAPGFRFEFDYLMDDGLERQGLAVGAVHNKRLYLIFYVGTRLHYFPSYRDNVERLIASIRLK